MNILDIANQLVSMNRQNLHLEIYEALYDTEHIVSVEYWGDGSSESNGLEAIKIKGNLWYSSIETIHEMRVSEPLVADKAFAVTFFMDITYKEGNALEIPAGRTAMTEMALYHVNEQGKIYREEFFS